MKRNSVEIICDRDNAIAEYKQIIETAKAENRSLTEEETTKLNDRKSEIDTLNDELRALKEEMEAFEREQANFNQNIDIKNIDNHKFMNKNLITEIRSAIENGEKKFTIDIYGRDDAAKTLTVTKGTKATDAGLEGQDGAELHDDVVQKEVKPIIDPLYAAPVLNQLGVRMYTGVPMGDVVLPVLGKGTAGWAAEVAKAAKSDNTVTSVTLKPHRIAAYVDLSNQLLAQDTIGFADAVRRDIEKALADAIEATFFGGDAGVTNVKPAGLFYNQTIENCDTFGALCDLEASVEEGNATGAMKYVASPKAKSYWRQTGKNNNATQPIMTDGAIDGTQVIVTSHVPAKQFIYGNFDDVIVAFWDSIQVTVDDISQAVNGVTRLILNGYVDFKAARYDGLKFGTIEAAAAPEGGEQGGGEQGGGEQGGGGVVS